MDGTHYATIGMDVSDRKTQVCVMAEDGKSPKIAMETVVPTTKEGLAKFLSTQDRPAPVAFETGMHCRWMNEAAEGPGFKVYVANPCRLRMTTESKTKNGVDDARMPARLALSDPGLLHPVKLRGPGRRRMPNLHEMRNLPVKRRTGVIVQMRAIARAMGFRIPKCPTGRFHRLDTSPWPREFRDIAWPTMKNLGQPAVTIKAYERQIRGLAQTPAFKAQVGRPMEIRYVGLHVATGFVAGDGRGRGQVREAERRGALARPHAETGLVRGHRPAVPHNEGGIPVHAEAPCRKRADDPARRLGRHRPQGQGTADMRTGREDSETQGRNRGGEGARGPDGGDAQEAGCAVCAAVGAVREGAACNEGDRMGRGFRRKSRQTVPGTGGGAKTTTAAQSGNA